MSSHLEFTLRETGMPTGNRSDYFVDVLEDCISHVLKVFMDLEDYSQSPFRVKKLLSNKLSHILALLHHPLVDLYAVYLKMIILWQASLQISFIE